MNNANKNVPYRNSLTKHTVEIKFINDQTLVKLVTVINGFT